MDEMVARCQSCGYEETAAFASCPVCFGASGWWCGACNTWCTSRTCPSCGGLLIVPEEIPLGSFPAGTRVPVRFSVRNPSKKSIEFAVSTTNPALSVLTRRLVIRSQDEGTIVCAIAIGAVAPGPRRYRVRLETPTPQDTDLLVHVVPSIVRVDFVPPELVVPIALPGTTISRNLTLNNTGNVPTTAKITVSDPWLVVQPTSVPLAPGESASLKVIARSRKTDSGTLSGQIWVATAEGSSCSAHVRIQLPAPELAASPVEFGDIHPDRPAYQTAVIRNTGKVRVALTLATNQPWLAVSPSHINLPVDGEKVVKLRAVIPTEKAGSHKAALLASCNADLLLRIPVSVNCRAPNPVLGPIRRQTLGAVASDEPVVRRFRATNRGDGKLKCTISANEPWIEIITKEISVGAGKKRRVEYRILTPSMPTGLNQAKIQIRSNGGDAEIPVSAVVVEPKPELDILGDLDLGTVNEETATGHISVRNSGVGILGLHIAPQHTRMTVAPVELALAPGPPTRIAVSIALAGLPGGAHSFAVKFASNGGNGFATVQLRTTVEEIDAPASINLGDRLVEHPTEEAVKFVNTGSDEMKLAVRAEDAWIQPLVDSIAVKAGELCAVPFRIHIRQGVSGPTTTAIWLEGRFLRHKVALQAVARRIELVATPNPVLLGTIAPGAERAVVLQVANRGDMAAEVSAMHIPGDLEVWVRRQVIQPGATVPLVCRVKSNSRHYGKEVEATIRLADETPVRFAGVVGRERAPIIMYSLASASVLAAGTAAAATGNWVISGLVALFGLLISFSIWAIARGK